MINPDDSPLVLPSGYRITYRFFLFPVRVAGKQRWCETLRVIQRSYIYESLFDLYKWVDVGFYDEVFPMMDKQPLYDRDGEL
jgi:hypothetical protein